MPYIEQRERDILDPSIDVLADKIRCLNGSGTGFAGMLNYAFTRLSLKTMPGKRYWTIALVIGTIICTALEFYRRLAAPYEDEKIKQNGGVYDA
jgi:hypothetical protein